MLVRQETSPDDFHGMVAAQAIVTARGGMTSHAAVVARGMGKTCVSGANALNIDYSQQQFTVEGTVVTKGEWITVDGSTGRVFLGQVPTIQPTLGNDFYKLMKWADQFRRLRVRANADTPLDAKTARQFGAEGIGLCRTEHMFFGDKRLAAMREMILSDGVGAREKALEKLLPLQRGDFIGIFREMTGLPVTIRLLDPPLHEFLPNAEELGNELAELKMKLKGAGTWSTWITCSTRSITSEPYCDRSIAFAKPIRCSVFGVVVSVCCFRKSRGCSVAQSSRRPAKYRANGRRLS